MNEDTMDFLIILISNKNSNTRLIFCTFENGRWETLQWNIFHTLALRTKNQLCFLKKRVKMKNKNELRDHSAAFRYCKQIFEMQSECLCLYKEVTSFTLIKSHKKNVKNTKEKTQTMRKTNDYTNKHKPQTNKHT